VLPAIEAEPRSRLHAVLTRDPQKAAAYPSALVYTKLEAALADAAIDAVYVGSPVALHAPQTLAALAADRDVLCEKPFGMNLAEAETMVAAAHEAGRLLGVAYYRRLYPKLVRARQLIAEGVIGQPMLIEASCHSWLDPNEPAWLVDPAMAAGGPLYDVGSHRIDACNFLLGEPLRATGSLSNAVHLLAVEDSATVLVTYQGGAHAIVDVRWNSRQRRDDLRILGTEGVLDLSPLSGPTLLVNGVAEELPADTNHHFPCVQNFVAAVLDGGALMCSGEEALWTDRVTGQVMGQNRSVRTG